LFILAVANNHCLSQKLLHFENHPSLTDQQQPLMIKALAAIVTTKKSIKNTESIKTRVLIVDDHPLVREWLKSIINPESDLMVCGEAESRDQALATAATTSPRVAIVDLTLKQSNGLELIKDFKIQFPSLAVLVLSTHNEAIYAERALYAGARGYITKQEASAPILQAIRTIATGGVSFSTTITQQILTRMTGTHFTVAAATVEQLSDRELEILRLIGTGYTTGQIAKQLSLAPNTVDTYRGRIREKLALTKPGELLRYAIHWVHSSEAS